jgi:hypothetical protein
MSLYPTEQWNISRVALPFVMSGLSIAPTGEYVFVNRSDSIFALSADLTKVYLVAGLPESTGNRTGDRFEEARFHFTSAVKGLLHLDPHFVFEDEKPGYPYTKLSSKSLKPDEPKSTFGYETIRFDHPIMIPDSANKLIKLLVRDTVLLYAGTKGTDRLDGSRKIAVFKSPSCITLHDDHFFISDIGHPDHVIRIISPAGMVTTVGSGNSDIDGDFSKCRFNFPYHITPFNNKFFDLYPDIHQALMTTNDESNETKSSSSTAFRPSHHPRLLIVSDSDNSRLRLLDLDREHVTQITDRAPHGLQWPRSSFVMPDGTVLIASLGTGSLLSLSLDIDAIRKKIAPYTASSLFHKAKITQLINSDATRRIIDIAVNNETGQLAYLNDNAKEVVIVSNFCTPWSLDPLLPLQANLSNLLDPAYVQPILGTYSSSNPSSPLLESLFDLTIKHALSGTSYFLSSSLLKLIIGHCANLPTKYSPYQFEPTPSFQDAPVLPPASVQSFIDTLQASLFCKEALDIFFSTLHGQYNIPSGLEIGDPTFTTATVQAINLYEQLGLPVHLPLLTNLQKKLLPKLVDHKTVASILCSITFPIGGSSVIFDAVAASLFVCKGGVDLLLSFRDVLLSLNEGGSGSGHVDVQRAQTVFDHLQHLVMSSAPNLTQIHIPTNYRTPLQLSLNEISQTMSWIHEKNAPRKTGQFCFSISSHSSRLYIDPCVLYPQWSWFKRMMDSGFEEAKNMACELNAEFPKGLLLSIVRYLYTHDLETVTREENDAKFLMDNGAEYGILDMTEMTAIAPFRPFVRSIQKAVSKDSNQPQYL